MKLQVLVDNNTYIDRYYLGEPAVSYYIETGGCRILFDTGYSDVCIKNARAMGIDMSLITHIVLSHGHNDHTGGLKYLHEQFDLSGVELIAHPHCFYPRHEGGEDIGSVFSEGDMARMFKYKPSRAPYMISESCCFLGQIPAHNDFENRLVIGKISVGGTEVDDTVQDDTALVCATESGLFIITGCSHSGICNIVEYAKSVCDDQRIAGIIGGFHLFGTDARLERTIRFLEDTSTEKLYPCHCISLKAKAEMMKHMDIEEVGVGLTIEP